MTSKENLFRLRIALAIAFGMTIRIEADDHLASGWLIAGVKATSIAGKPLDLKAEARLAGHGLVVAFTSTSCPVSRQYGPTLVRLEKWLQARGFKLVMVNPVATDPSDQIKAFVADFPPGASYIHDRDQTVAKAFGARSTTEVFVIDKAATVRYRGAIDDQFGVGTALVKPRHAWLEEACLGILENKPGVMPSTEPSGCLLDSSGSGPVFNAAGMTFHNRISRIIQQNCVECHQESGLAPFSLERYEDLKSHRAMIEREVNRNQMPPWFAAPMTMKGHPGWSNDRSLSATDKRDLLSWLKSEMPLGDSADAALAVPMPAIGWQIGKPDLVYQLTSPIEIPAQGKMPYQHRTIETKLIEDTWIQAVEIRPKDPSVVHHVLVFVAPPESVGEEDRESPDDRRGFFAGYVPGTSAMIFPEGYGKKLPKGSRLRFQIHYTPNGHKTVDQMQFGMRVARAKPAHELHVFGVANPGLRIPAGAANHVEVARQLVPTDLNLMAFMPHTHVRGKAFKYEIQYPDNRRETLLDVPRYDFNWQLRYKLARPIAVPKGSTIIATATYDNSEGNKANPDPSKTVFWGQQTDEEMMLGYLEYEITGEKAEFQKPFSGPLAALIPGKTAAERRERFFNLMDKDKDGFLTMKEMQFLATLVPQLRENPDRLQTIFKTLDTNDDGKIDRSELKSIRNLAGG